MNKIIKSSINYLLECNITLNCLYYTVGGATHIYLTAFPAIQSCVVVFFYLCLCDQKDVDASYSHPSAVNTDTDFDRRWGRGPHGPRTQKERNMNRVWNHHGDYWSAPKI